MTSPARPLSGLIIAAVCVAWLVGFSFEAQAQEQAVSATGPQTITAKKLDITKLRSGGIYEGYTAVDLEPG